MNKLVMLLAVIAATTGFATERTVFRDAMGRQTGTAERNGNKIIYRDAMGRQTGTAQQQQNGRVTYRDEMGRQTGTAQSNGKQPPLRTQNH